MYNIYCDESCHLELSEKKPEEQKSMVLGAVWCDKEYVRQVRNDILEIKLRHNIKKYAEIKWTRVSPSKIEFYKEIISYFFSNDELHFRGLIVPDKSILNHKKYNQSHDDWYYKMYFDMLKIIIDPRKEYSIYLDIKDDRSAFKTKKLGEYLANSVYDFNYSIIRNIQNVRSHECVVLQLTDLMIGALGYLHRGDFRSNSKCEIVNQIKELSGYSLTRNTLYKEDKFNLLIWNGSEGI